MKTRIWCSHIKWLKGYKGFWMFLTKGSSGLNYDVPHSWRCCPICLKLRPTSKKNESIKDLVKRCNKEADRIIKNSGVIREYYAKKHY